ncbi:MarR family winged helix-turn-helix transcriptional regulator [Pseudomonas sp. X10]
MKPRHLFFFEISVAAGGIYLSIHSAAMTRMLNRLEGKALIVRTRDPIDQRQMQLALTEKGLAVNERLPKLAGAAMNEFAAGLTALELSQLAVLLEKMLLARGTEGTVCHCTLRSAS